MINYTDRQILDAIRTGNDKDVLKSIYKNVLPNVEKYICANSGSKDDAFDLFQDAVIILYKQVSNRTYNEEKYKIAGFLYTVSKNLWINRAKKKSVEKDWYEKKQEDEIEPTVLEDLIDSEKKKLLNHVFKQIGDECVKLLTYSVYQELTMKEIADIIGMTENNVRVQSHRCKKKLRELVLNNSYLNKNLAN